MQITMSNVSLPANRPFAVIMPSMVDGRFSSGGRRLVGSVKLSLAPHFRRLSHWQGVSAAKVRRLAVDCSQSRRLSSQRSGAGENSDSLYQFLISMCKYVHVGVLRRPPDRRTGRHHRCWPRRVGARPRMCAGTLHRSTRCICEWRFSVSARA